MQASVFIPISLILCFCVLYCYGYSDCGSEVGSIVNVEISGCQKNKKCILRRNTTATMNLSFTTQVDSTNLTAVVHGVIFSVPAPFDLPNPNGCKDSGITCPIKAGETYQYTTSMPIDPNYPRVTVDIKWELRTDDDRDYVCALIPSKIV